MATRPMWSRPLDGEPMPEVRRLARHGYDPGQLKSLRRKRWERRLKSARGVIGFAFHAVTPPVRQFVSDHWMSVSALVCGDWAAWLWNPKAGLIALAVLLVVFEIKVSN